MKPLLVGYSGDGHPVHLTQDDLRTHVHGIGASRSGKSKFAEGIARQLTLNREGFCLIDPHGFLVADLLRWLAYVNPGREVVVLDPSSTARVVGFNPFHTLGTDTGARVDRIVQVILKAWGQETGDETPRLERWLRCLGHVLVEGGYTINLAPHLVSWERRELRQDVIARVKDRLTIHIRQEWEELATYRRLPDFNAQIESTKNRLLRFVDSLPIRRMMGIPSNNLDVRGVIERGAILLVNLQPSADFTKDHARVVGALLVNDLWEVARRRQQRPGGRPRPFHLLIDEFHEYLIPDVPEMLTGGAKYGLHLWLFHQNLDQLRVREPAVFGALDSARIKLAFGGLGRVDARLMAENIFPGQVDLKRIKFRIEQTKILPRYTREKVHSSAGGGGEGTFSGISNFYGVGESSSPAWDPSTAGWIDLRGSNASFGGGSSSGSTEFTTWNKGTADVPFLMPELFKETSSIKEYSLEEQLWKCSDELMEQPTRQFFLRRPGERTLALLAPRIKPRSVTPERLAWYLEQQLSAFLTTSEVDCALAGINRQLGLETSVAALTLTEDEYVR